MVNVSQSIKHSTVLMTSFMVDTAGSLMYATRETVELFTCDATKVATTWSHPCIKYTTGKADSQRSILYCNIQQTFSGTHTAFKYLSIHLQLPYRLTKMTRGKYGKYFLRISVFIYVHATRTHMHTCMHAGAHTCTHTHIAWHPLSVVLIKKFFRSKCTIYLLTYLLHGAESFLRS